MAATQQKKCAKGITFGLIYFASSEAPYRGGEKYHMVLESARLADRYGFSSIWIPERHFTKDGWLYPNPAVLQAAVARETKKIQLRSGSVVLPLHNPIRVAEEWAMVDNLSNGRVGLSFASGWHPNDFVFFPDHYERRNDIMFQGIETVRKLWRGESIVTKNGAGEMVEIKTYPTPVQKELPIWVTAAGNPKTFAGAGKMGANLLTHMYNQSVEELAEKIRIYRDSLEEHGFDPQAGQVSVMLHTFLGPDEQTVREQVKDPFCNYLKSASYLLNAIAYSRGQKVDLSSLSEQDLDEYLQFVLDRMISTQRVLFGTPESCLNLVSQLREAGVNEVACQLDFGLEVDVALGCIPYINQLKELAERTFPTDPEPEPLVLHATSQEASEERAPEAQVEAASDRLEDIQQRCRDEVSVSTFYADLQTHGIELGADYRAIRQLWRRDGEALGRIQYDGDATGPYQFPHALLDSCLQVVTATLPDSLVKRQSALYLPSGIKSFKLHKQPGAKVWSHAVLTSEPVPGAAVLESDVRILDDAGQVLIEASGIQLQRSEAATSAHTPDHLSDWLYTLQWKEESQTEAPATERPGHWLILMDRQGIGQCLLDALVSQGQRCSVVTQGETYQVLGTDRYQASPANADDIRRVVQQAVQAEPLRGVVHLWSLDAASEQQLAVSTLEQDLERCTGSALYTMQALIELAGGEPPRLWLITRNAQALEEPGQQLAIGQAPLWGLGRTCSMEHPEIWGGLIDLAPDSSPATNARQVAQELMATDHEDQVAFRAGKRFVARMQRSHDIQAQDWQIRPDASYLITGGFWGLGFEVARWLARKGAKHLVLTGRTQVPPRAQWGSLDPASRTGKLVQQVRELEATGVQVQCVTLDVTDEAQVNAFLATSQQQGTPPIKGVFHAASVWQDSEGRPLVKPLVNLDAFALREVFRPKVIGGWLLHSIFQKADLDFFVSFSSGASLFGSAAQGNYAAASAFLDALAHYQRAQGVPGISIDWGAVSEIGFGATEEGLRVHEYWEDRGIQRITPRDVLAALDLLIPLPIAQIGVLKLDWELLRRFYPQVASLPLVAHLLEATDEEQSQEAQEDAILTTLRDTANRQQELEHFLCEQVASVLRVPPEKLDVEQPLTMLGLDSLMAIELKNRVEQALQVRIPIVMFLQGPSIRQFTEQVLEMIPLAEPAPAAEPEAVQHGNGQKPLSQNEAEQLLQQLEQLSDAEVDVLLGQMLQEDGQEPAHTNGKNHVSAREAEQLLAQLEQLPDEEIDSLLQQIVQEGESDR